MIRDFCVSHARSASLEALTELACLCTVKTSAAHATQSKHWLVVIEQLFRTGSSGNGDTAAARFAHDLGSPVLPLKLKFDLLRTQ